MTRPGDSLRRRAARRLSADAMTRVVDPAIADLQLEYEIARTQGRIWMSRWIYAVSSIAVVCIVLRLVAGQTGLSIANPNDDDRRVRYRLIASALVALVLVTVAVAVQPLVRLGRHLPIEQTWVLGTLIPMALPLSIPVAIVLGLATALGSAKLSKNLVATILAIALAGSAVSFVTMAWIMPAASQTLRTAMTPDGVSVPIQRGIRELTLGELRAATRPLYPHDRLHVVRVELSYYSRLAFPCASLTFTLIILAVRPCRSPRAWQRFSAGIGTCVAYYSLMVIGEKSAIGGTLPAMLGAWLPNITLTALVVTVPSLRRRHAQTSTRS